MTTRRLDEKYISKSDEGKSHSRLSPGEVGKGEMQKSHVMYLVRTIEVSQLHTGLDLPIVHVSVTRYHGKLTNQSRCSDS